MADNIVIFGSVARALEDELPLDREFGDVDVAYMGTWGSDDERLVRNWLASQGIDPWLGLDLHPVDPVAIELPRPYDAPVALRQIHGAPVDVRWARRKTISAAIQAFAYDGDPGRLADRLERLSAEGGADLLLIAGSDERPQLDDLAALRAAASKLRDRAAIGELPLGTLIGRLVDMDPHPEPRDLAALLETSRGGVVLSLDFRRGRGAPPYWIGEQLTEEQLIAWLFPYHVASDGEACGWGRVPPLELAFACELPAPSARLVVADPTLYELAAIAVLVMRRRIAVDAPGAAEPRYTPSLGESERIQLIVDHNRSVAQSDPRRVGTPNFQIVLEAALDRRKSVWERVALVRDWLDTGTVPFVAARATNAVDIALLPPDHSRVRRLRRRTAGSESMDWAAVDVAAVASVTGRWLRHDVGLGVLGMLARPTILGTWTAAKYRHAIGTALVDELSIESRNRYGRSPSHAASSNEES